MVVTLKHFFSEIVGDSSKNNNFRTVYTIFSRIVVKFVKLSIFSAHHSGKTLFYNSEI